MTVTNNTNINMEVVRTVIASVEKYAAANNINVKKMGAEELAVFMDEALTGKEVNTVYKAMYPEAPLTGKGITKAHKIKEVIKFTKEQAKQEFKQQEEKPVEKQKSVPSVEEQKAEQERRIQATVSFINQRMGGEVVTIHTPVAVLKDMATKLKAIPVTPTFTKEQLEQAVQSGYQAGVEETVAKVQVPEAPKPQTEEKPVQAKVELTADQKAKLIPALEAQLKELHQEQINNATNKKKFHEAVLKYRAVEEELVRLKGGDVQKLIKEKYNGFTQAATKAAFKAADVTEKYGHQTVDKGTELLNNIFNTVIGVTRDVINVTERTGQAAINIGNQVGHAGVDLTAGAFRATGEFIGKK